MVDYEAKVSARWELRSAAVIHGGSLPLERWKRAAGDRNW
jgi:hypothetical protein